MSVQIFDDEKDKQIIEDATRNLLDQIEQFLPNVCILTVKKALDFSVMAHHGQRRQSGEPYVIHPIKVAQILAELNLDTATIVCALLHDVVEDTGHTITEIEKIFGEEEAKIVEGLTKIHKIESQSISIKKTENLRKLLMAVADDARVLLVKLADRLHNMRTLDSLRDNKKKMRIAKETIDVYAPLAERIGIHFFKNVLYDLAFEVLYPDVRQSIINQITILKAHEENYINKIIREISSLMEQSQLKVEVKGREKSPFSIWQKMERKQITFEELSDVFAIRIIAHDPMTCYAALGIIHIHYKVVSKEFCDYISTPKKNGYRSIHTVILVDNSTRVEVQIRTAEMNQISELGMAAHWVYKSGDQEHKNYCHQEWLNKIRLIMENIANTNDVLANVKLEMYPDQVFCFTPAGDVVALPRDATPLDFAFEVATGLGLRYSKALVNGKNAGIATRLQNGDQVEILTADHITITHHWLDIVCTSKARSEIQVFLERKLVESIVFAGNLSIYDECEKYGLSVDNDRLEKVASSCNTNTVANLFFSVGNGTIAAEKVAKQLAKGSLYERLCHFFKSTLLFNKSEMKNFTTLAHLKFNSEIKFSYCCNPGLRGSAFGIYNKSRRSVTIHSPNCYMVNNLKADEEVINIVLYDAILNATEVLLSITITDAHYTNNVFHVFTEFGISNYTINIVESNEQSLTLSVSLRVIMPHQLRSLINKVKSLEGVLDVVIVDDIAF